MQNFLASRLLEIVGVAAVAIAAVATPSFAATPSPASTGVAVVELFTSQGCSSCPPAERVISELNTAAAADHLPVFTLAFHVDYWDRLGWRDVFSDSAYTKRQYDYAGTLKLDQVYTPQMIVNGREQFVGSDKGRADAAIQNALQTPASVPVTVSVAAADGGGYRLRFSASAAGGGQVLNVGVIEQGLSTDVKRGENAGTTMKQPSVVRWFKSVVAAPAGSVIIPDLPAVQAGHTSMVAYIQRTADGAILGASAVRLP